MATAEVLRDQLADINHIRFPRVDYIELQRLLGAETLDYSLYGGNFRGQFLRYLETQLRSDIFLATISWSRFKKYQQVFAWSERAGIPLAAYRRYSKSNSRFVTLFACWSKRQEFAITKLHLFPSMDHIIVQCSSMRDQLVSLGAPAEKVHIIHHGIDQNFFSPLKDMDQQSNQIMSIGEPRSRDYPSLFRAVEDLPVHVKLPAYGHWYAREKERSLATCIPPNVSLLKHMSHIELRDLYAQSQFVVLPIRDLVYSAGATATLEAGSMARAVIAFHSKGISDYIIDGETGILIEPGNIAELRNAIQFLIANPAESRRMGQNARDRIKGQLSFERYVNELGEVLIRN